VNKEKGSIVIIIVGSIPILIGLIAMVIWIGQVSYMKVRLQIAADRSAHAGASYVAHALNSIAASNRKISEAFRELEEDFAMDTQQDQEAANQRIEKYEATKNKEVDNIGSILDVVEGNAKEIAMKLLDSNASGSVGEIYVDSVFSIFEDFEPNLQWNELSYNIVTGSNFIDPDDVDGGSFNALKYLVKRRDSDASIIVMARKYIHPFFYGDSFGGGVAVDAISAAKAYGGSIKNHALEGDKLYRSAVIPVRTVGGEGFVY